MRLMKQKLKKTKGLNVMIETVLSRSLRLMFSGGVAISLGLAGAPACAQVSDAPMPRVEITGSSIKRLATETVLPVTILERADIERSGASSAQELVNLIPANFGGGVAANNVGGGGAPSTANLRALGPKYTLVLLNGRRVANYAVRNAAVDLNSIPLSAIERIEVLRDGASAVYGADAVAGVINFILKKDYQGMAVSAYATRTDQGGGDVSSFNLSGGVGNLARQRFNLLFSANHEVDDVLHATERGFANTAKRPDLGINKASPRNGVPNLNFSDSRGNKYVGVNPFRYNGCDNVEFALVVISEKACGTDYVKYIDLIPETKHDNLVARGVFQLSDEHQLFAEAAYTKDSLSAAYSPAPYPIPMSYPVGGRFYPSRITLPAGLQLPAGYVNPDGSVRPAASTLASDLDVTPSGPLGGTWRTVAGGPRTNLTEAKNLRMVFGVKGVLAGWDYDTAVNYGKNQVAVFFGQGKFSYKKLTPLVDSGAINMFGSQDATSLAALQGARITGFQNGGTSTQKEFDVRVSKALFQLPSGGVGFSLGSSYRTEKLDQVSSPVLASGDEVGGAGEIPSLSGQRKVLGVFTEVIVPVFKGAELTAAARYDSYRNGFGTKFDNISPKLGLSYRPGSTLLLRGSAGRGFRAPTLVDKLQPKALNSTASTFSDPLRCPNGVPINASVGLLQDECKVQLPIQNSGNPNLRPEKSTQWTVGAAFQPFSFISASLDYWHVNIDQAINSMSEKTVLGDPAGNVSQFWRYNPDPDPQRNPDGRKPLQGSTNPAFPLAFIALPKVNTGKFFAAGVDLNINVRQRTGIGLFSINYDATRYSEHGYQYQGSPAVSDLGDFRDFGPAPRYRHQLSLVWSKDVLSASLSHNYTDGYLDATDRAGVGKPNYPAIRKVDAYATFDATLGWRAMTGLNFGLGIKNLLDQDPPSSRNGANFQTGYDATFTNPLGRTFYLRATYKFL